MAMNTDSDIIEIENVIPVDYQRHLLQTMTSQEFSWILNTNMVSGCLLYTSPSPRDRQKSRMPSSA